jgi:hypothetical protein
MRRCAVLLLFAACTVEHRVEVSVRIALASDDPATATVDATATAEELSGHGDHPGVSGLDIAVVLDGVMLALPQVGEGTYTAPQQIGFPGTVVAIVEGDELAVELSPLFTLAASNLTLTIDPPIFASEHAGAYFDGPAFSTLALPAGTDTVDLPAGTTLVGITREHDVSAGFYAATLVERTLAITGSARSDRAAVASRPAARLPAVAPPVRGTGP